MRCMSNLIAKHDSAIFYFIGATAAIKAVRRITITSKPCFATLIAEFGETLFAHTTHISGPNAGNRMFAGSNI